MITRLLLIRHGRTPEKYRNRYIGSTDVPLSEEGMKDAETLAGKLKNIEITAVWSSPLKRALETAKIAMGSRSHLIDQYSDLKEIDFGSWEDLTFEEILRIAQDQVKKWAEDYENFAFPGGESRREFTGRIRRIMDKIDSHPPGCLALFTHGGVIRSLICGLLGLPWDSYLKFGVKNGSITIIHVEDGRGVLMGLINPESDIII